MATDCINSQTNENIIFNQIPARVDKNTNSVFVCFGMVCQDLHFCGCIFISDMKDPAFLFYSSDFLTGVSDLTFEERGQFITLLCLQHQKGRLTKKMIDLVSSNISNDVLLKFKIDESGLYYNERLEVEAKKREEHANKQRERALSGWENRKKAIINNSHGNATALATAMPLENDNVIENKDLNRCLSSEISEGLNPDFVNYINYTMTRNQPIELLEEYAGKRDCYFQLILNLQAFQKLRKNLKVSDQVVHNHLKEFLRYNAQEKAEPMAWNNLLNLQDHAYKSIRKKINQ